MFTINNPNIMKKSKYQQYFYCFIFCLLISYAFWFSYQQNIVTVLISAGFGGEALIRGEALISMWIPEGEALIRRNTVSLSEWFYKCNDLHKCNAGMRNFQKFRISRNFVQVNVASGFFFSLIDSWWTILKSHAHSH